MPFIGEYPHLTNGWYMADRNAYQIDDVHLMLLEYILTISSLILARDARIVISS